MTEAVAPAEAETAKWRVHRLLFDRAPRIFAILAFLAGASLTVTAVMPSNLPAHQWIDVPPILSMVGAIGLMAMALGLAQRIQTAYIASLMLMLVVAVSSLIYEMSPIRAGIFFLLVIAMLAARHAFFRKANLNWFRPGRIWFLAVALAIAHSAMIAALLIGKKTGLVDRDAIAQLVDPAVWKVLQPIAAALAIVVLIAFVRLVAQPGRPDLAIPTDDDQARMAKALEVAGASRPEAILGYLGDKRFLFSDSGMSFIAYAATSTMLVSMGGPTGDRSEFEGLIKSFVDMADEKGVSPVLYAVAPETLPELLEQSFKVQKIGENAILDLSTFTLSGRKREAMRRGRRKLAERQGATFELSLPPHKPELLERLKPISDAWLADVGGKEKSFSLGKFDRDFLNHCPIGITALNGETVAFGTLFTTPNKSWAGIDLMRYDPEKSITNTMDFLFAELILWCQREGYQKFDLSMAPLAGLDVSEAEQSLFTRIGHLIYTHGERFYNFQGLRRFKAKFAPEWEPRYIAAPASWLLPAGLAQAARLTNNKTNS